MARQTKPQPHFVLSQISRPRVVCFNHRIWFALWGLGERWQTIWSWYLLDIKHYSVAHESQPIMIYNQCYRFNVHKDSLQNKISDTPWLRGNRYLWYVGGGGVGGIQMELNVFFPTNKYFWHERTAFQRSAFGRSAFGRSTAGNDVVATIFISLFSFFFSRFFFSPSVVTFSHRRSTRIKKLI